jgi:hypothetical protein
VTVGFDDGRKIALEAICTEHGYVTGHAVGWWRCRKANVDARGQDEGRGCRARRIVVRGNREMGATPKSTLFVLGVLGDRAIREHRLELSKHAFCLRLIQRDGIADCCSDERYG